MLIYITKISKGGTCIVVAIPSLKTAARRSGVEILMQCVSSRPEFVVHAQFGSHVFKVCLGAGESFSQSAIQLYKIMQEIVDYMQYTTVRILVLYAIGKQWL